MRSDLIYIPDSELDALIQQDTPYLDLTTLGLDIGDEPGSLSFYTREACVLCCTEEVSRILTKLGLSTAYSLPTGTQIGAGELFFTAEGSVCDLHRAWKICQSLLSHCSGVATKARNMLSQVQAISPAISLTAARAHFPGTKALVTKAVVAGGVIPHRMGLSETVLIYETHIACMGGLEVFLNAIPSRKATSAKRKSLWKHSPQRRRSAVSPWAWMPSSFSRCSRMRWQRLWNRSRRHIPTAPSSLPEISRKKTWQNMRRPA